MFLWPVTLYMNLPLISAKVVILCTLLPAQKVVLLLKSLEKHCCQVFFSLSPFTDSDFFAYKAILLASYNKTEALCKIITLV